MRTCIACRTARPQGTLIRYRRRRDGEVVPSLGRHGVGRSAYLCADASCMARATSRHGFTHALGRGRVVRCTDLTRQTIVALDREIEASTRNSHGAPRLAWLLACREALTEPGGRD